ncbi:hypothetical protein ACKWTF_008972 [Chironomus riparius]
MNKNFIVSVVVIIIYAVLLGTFIKLYNDINNHCTESSPCIRFCSTNSEEFPDSTLLNKFLTSASAEKFCTNPYIVNTKVYRGSPTCGGMSFSELGSFGNSTIVHYNFDQTGNVYINKHYYGYDRYCLEKSELEVDGWKLKICDQDITYFMIFNIIGSFISIFLLLLTTLVYGYYKELRDAYGKCTISYLVSQILTYILVTSFMMSQSYKINGPFMAIMFLISILNILICITAMISHSFITFRNFKIRAPISFEVSKYVVIILIFQVIFGVLFSILFKTLEIIIILILLFVSIWFFDAMILIIIGFKILSVSQRLLHSEQARFDEHQKWYWICVKFHFLMLVTFPFETLALTSKFNLLFFLLASFINVFTACIITITLLGRKKVKILLFKNYREIYNQDLN